VRADEPGQGGRDDGGTGATHHTGVSHLPPNRLVRAVGASGGAALGRGENSDGVRPVAPGWRHEAPGTESGLQAGRRLFSVALSRGSPQVAASNQVAPMESGLSSTRFLAIIRPTMTTHAWQSIGTRIAQSSPVQRHWLLDGRRLPRQRDGRPRRRWPNRDNDALCQGLCRRTPRRTVLYVRVTNRALRNPKVYTLGFQSFWGL
jgi:hypothetical protein